MFPSSSCWRCSDELGTHFHIWWDCQLLSPFWHLLFHIYRLATGDLVFGSPALALLSMPPALPPRRYRDLLYFFMAAARSVIVKSWKSPTSPGLGIWIEALDYLQSMEEKVASDNATLPTFYTRWSPWLTFRFATFLGCRLYPSLSFLSSSSLTFSFS